MTYKFLLILSLKIFCSCQLADNNSSYINKQDFSIKNAVYIIRNREGNVNLENGEKLEFTNTKSNLKKNFELIRNSNENSDPEVFYFIKDKEKNILLSAENNGDHLTFYSKDIDINYALWKIIPKINEENKLIYYVQNKANKWYWELINQNNMYQLKLSSIWAETNLTKANEFLFIELFQNVDVTNSELLEKEPIDVLIKYIDLTDSSLNRTGIHQLKKDFDNSELKYSVRSILQNIPWIRKIFILMPNEKVRFFKPKEEIKDKIVYVKDKDLLGFDSGNSCTFQYNLYKMKQYGLSENFILMDDDYFIAKPINKNEMFYEENGKIYPAIITSDYYEMNRELIISQINDLRKKRQSDDPHSPNGFYISQKISFLFLYDLLGNDNIRKGKKLIEPAFSHNAIPMKISDIEELHKYIYDYYQFGKYILFSKERSVNDLQFQTLYWAYVKNKYNRKVSKITSEFYDLSQSNKVISNTKKLFVINTSSRNYNPIFYRRQKDILERLFPIKTKYEIEEIQSKISEETNLSSKNIIDPILLLFVNEINKKVKFDPEKLLSGIEHKSKNNSKENQYKNLLLEEIDYMKELCLWQEITNYAMFVFFVIMMLYRYYIKCFK